MTVKFFATLKLKLGVASVKVDGEPGLSVGEAVKRAEEAGGRPFWSEIFDQLGNTRPGAMVLLDGTNISHLQGVDTPIGEAEAISIFPPAGGG
ncbi:MAG: MoaD/ThiS family protein [Spirochaetaceae bacterium]|nr:MAG: MoaD/ThiS family protein [Spirochaetaceae bacterium]